MEKIITRRNGDQHTLMFDEVDLPLVESHSWFVHVTGRSIYAVTMTSRPDRRCVRMHRLILPGYPEVDHINGDGLDNRRANLRGADRQENARNQRLRANNTSGYKGIWLYRDGRWAAMIRRRDGRRKFLGYHPTPEDAARAYDVAAIQEHGEFAHLNFPGGEA